MICRKGSLAVGTDCSATKKHTHSRYRGVTWSDVHGKWIAGVNIANARVAIGQFEDEEEGRSLSTA